MNILILACSTDVGCGIGDHVRLLAAEFEKRGRLFKLISLPDLREDNLSAIIESQDSRCKPLVTSVHFNFKTLQQHFPLSRLARLLESKRPSDFLHIMFHELWDKSDGVAPVRWAKNTIKKALIHRFLARSRPRLAHTNSTKNVRLLRAIGTKAKLLPIFSNFDFDQISWSRRDARDWLAKISNSRINERTLVGVFFGTARQNWRFRTSLNLLQASARKTSREILIVRIGDPLATLSWRQFLQDGGDLQIIELGPLAAQDIPPAFLAADFGFVVTPSEDVARSTVAAAFIEAGLTIMVPDNADALSYSHNLPQAAAAQFLDASALRKQPNLVRFHPHPVGTGLRHKVIDQLLDDLSPAHFLN